MISQTSFNDNHLPNDSISTFDAHLLFFHACHSRHISLLPTDLADKAVEARGPVAHRRGRPEGAGLGVLFWVVLGRVCFSWCVCGGGVRVKFWCTVVVVVVVGVVCDGCRVLDENVRLENAWDRHV